MTLEEPISYRFPIHFETDINKIFNRVKGVIESKKLEQALKGGTIIKILEFIKEYNHF